MRAICTWGDGPDVMAVIEGTPVILYEDPKRQKPPRGNYKYGYITKGSFDLTAEEAESFANELLEAARQTKEMINSYCEYMKGVKDESIRNSSSDSRGEKKK